MKKHHGNPAVAVILTNEGASFTKTVRLDVSPTVKVADAEMRKKFHSNAVRVDSWDTLERMLRGLNDPDAGLICVVARKKG